MTTANDAPKGWDEFGPRKSGRGCRVCGKPIEITVRAQAFNMHEKDGKLVPTTTLTGRSIGMCNAHALIAYAGMSDVLDGVIQG